MKKNKVRYQNTDLRKLGKLTRLAGSLGAFLNCDPSTMSTEDFQRMQRDASEAAELIGWGGGTKSKE